MKRALKKQERRLFHYSDGIKINGANPDMTGEFSGLYGNCSLIYGDCSDLSGDCSGVYGNASGILGNLDDCKLSAQDRIRGVPFNELIKQ